MDDLIRRSEAIRVASGYCHWSNIPKELEKLPSVNPIPCGDAISRQEAIDAMATWDLQELYLPIHFKQLLEDLPSVSTEKTQMIDKSNFDEKQYRMDLQCAYECGKNSVTEKVGWWIPVSEPPKEEGRYICDYGDCIDFGSYHDGHWYIQGAVAYMPLPQPYKAESEG